MRRYSPPTFACWLFESVLPSPYREAMLGDLIEEYTLRIESTSPFTASRWFWSQACRSVPSMIWSSVRSGNCFISMGVAVSVYISMGMLKFAADLMISKWVAPDQTTYVVLAPIVFLTTAATGGCIAAQIRRGATISLIARDDYSCRLDLAQGLHDTGTLVVSGRISNSRASGGVDHSVHVWDARGES
jgi:hypothetical protein